MEQLSLFDVDAFGLELNLKNPKTSDAPSQRGLSISGTPKVPGWYYAYVGASMEQTSLFWNGFKWVDIHCRTEIYIDSKICYLSNVSFKPEVPVIKTELLSKDKDSIMGSYLGWRKDNPPFPGVFFATNAITPNTNYIKTWDGHRWSNNVMTGYIDSEKRMIWLSTEFPSEAKIIAKLGL